MSKYTTNKKKFIELYQTHKNDTGSFYLQLKLLIEKINFLKQHILLNKKDIHNRYGLIKLLSKKKKIIKYLKL